MLGYNTCVRRSVLDRVQRIVIAIIVLALVGIALIGAQVAGIGFPNAHGLLPQGVDLAAYGKEIAIVSGHRGNDSGAICEDEDGNPTLKEVDVNARIAEAAADGLRRVGASVTTLDEYDPRIDDLKADVFLSIHADSCIDQSGFKAAHYLFTKNPEADELLVDCLKSEYAAATGLTYNSNTVTENMTEYHSFHHLAQDTPAAILEVGFLGGDRALLESSPQIAAQGVVNGLLCFLRGGVTPTPEP